MVRKRLSEILNGSDKDRLERSWGAVKAAEDLKPIPGGQYRCGVVNGELFTSRTNATPGYKITFEILDGDHSGRRVWHDVWLSDNALPFAKRDLAKLGIEDPSQLEGALPEGIIVTAKVALRRDNDGSEYNRVARFDVIAVEAPPPEPFAPSDHEGVCESCDEDGFDWATGTQTEETP